MKKIIISLLLSIIMLVSLPSVFGQVCVAPPANLVSWWDGDAVSGTIASDLQGLNDGTLENGATTAVGKVGDAFFF